MRAIEQTPRTCGSLLNSAFKSGLEEPPVPVPFGQPACAVSYTHLDVYKRQLQVPMLILKAMIVPLLHIKLAN